VVLHATKMYMVLTPLSDRSPLKSKLTGIDLAFSETPGAIQRTGSQQQQVSCVRLER
jgi:hypothetical protein